MAAKCPAFRLLQGSTIAVPHLELNLAPTAADMPDMALELIRAIIAAATTTGMRRPCC
jgi:hypothetical protein